MSVSFTPSTFAPLRVRSYRFQWSADLLASWAAEMELILLGWYVLVATESVMLLTVFASLPYIGTLFSPLVGMMGDRLGHRVVLCAMRAFYALMAATLMGLTLTDSLAPWQVFVIAGLTGLVRASDVVMRYSLIGETMPAEQVAGALGLSRATMDSARIMGALAGAGIVAVTGMGLAYVAVTALYASSLALTFRISGGAPRPAREAAVAAGHRASTLIDLKDAVAHVWQAPHLKAGLILALLLNLTAFPMVHGLLPYVAKHIYLANQTVLGYMVAALASGAMLGSITFGRFGHRVRSARMMMGFAFVWYLALILFAIQQSPATGIVALFFSGFVQSLCLVPLAAMLVRTSHERLRGRVLGLRALAVYGLPVGLWIAGPLIEHHGFRTMAVAYCLTGLVFAGWIAVRWRKHLWLADAPGNAR